MVPLVVVVVWRCCHSLNVLLFAGRRCRVLFYGVDVYGGCCLLALSLRLVFGLRCC